MIKNIFITMLIISAQFLLGMENIWHNPTIKNDLHIDVAQRYFSHESICALALVNKQWNAFVQQTAKYRRRYLANQEEYKKDRPTYNSTVYKQTTWHKHNSAYAYWIENSGEQIQYKKPITLYFVYLDGNTTICAHKSENFYVSDLNCSIMRYNAPFFDNKGDVHHYVYETIDGSIYIVEYVMGIKKSPRKVACWIDIMHKNAKWQLIKENLFILIHYSTLLEAFINSKHITENDDEKIYHADGVELDENYVLNGRFPRIAEVSLLYRRQYRDITYPQDSSRTQQAIISRCKIKNGKILLLLCAQQDKANIISLLPDNIMRLIFSFFVF